MNRIIIRKRKKPIPKLALQTEYIKQAKTYEEMNKNELMVLIDTKRHELSHAYSEEEYIKLRTEIRLLEDLHILKIFTSIDKFNKYRNERKDRLFINDLGLEAHCILNRLGYRVPLYTEECIEISKHIDNSDLHEDIKQIVALSIVKEIMDHYKAKFNEKECLELYNINEEQFYEYHFLVHTWCRQNYWKGESFN